MKNEFCLDNLSRDIKVDLYEDLLNRGIDLRVKVTGKSMDPYLKGGEVLIIKKVPPASLHIGDLIFFKDQHGIPVLHRIMKINSYKRNKYIIQTKGDGVIAFDEAIDESLVMGKVCMIEKKTASGKRKLVNMESFYEKNRNYFIALCNIMKSKFYVVYQRFSNRRV